MTKEQVKELLSGMTQKDQIARELAQLRTKRARTIETCTFKKLREMDRRIEELEKLYALA